MFALSAEDGVGQENTGDERWGEEEEKQEGEKAVGGIHRQLRKGNKKRKALKA